MENMKHAKKLLGLLLALAMVLCLAATAFATGGADAAETQLATGDVAGGGNAGGDAQTGSITIGSPVAGETYSIYLMFTLESYDTATGAYSYKITDAWRDFVNSGYGKDYFAINDQGYVTMKEGVTVENDSETAATLAKEALAYAKSKTMSPVKTLPESGSYTASGLQMGYYLVDSSLGTLCSLGTATDNVTINEKNAEPTLLKEVEEDSRNLYGGANDAEIGQTVNFRATITAQAGAQNYVYHDTMTGLEFDSVTGVTLNGTEVAADGNYVVKTSGLETSSPCTFHVEFTETFCDTLEDNDKIVISYQAKVKSDATVGGDGNPNTGKLSYGETGTSETEPSVTKTYTWEFDVLKYANGNESAPLAGVEFVLLNSDKSKVATIVDTKLTGWVAVPTAESGKEIVWPTNTILTTDADGKIHVGGIDSGDMYYLREVKSLPGYNKLKDDESVQVQLESGSSLLGRATVQTTTMRQAELLVKVNNQSGAQLPSTGGIGTTIFYVLGSALLIGAVVLLVARKRMNAEK
jgi:hypothetical protein